MSIFYLRLFAMAILSLTFFGCGSTGRLTLTDGNLNFLKGEKSIKVVYLYDNLKVGEMVEEAYLNRESSEKNAKEPGTGEEWIKQWFANREERFQPTFEELLNNNLEGKAIFGSNLQDTKYTLVLKTASLEPGYNVFVSRRDADIDAVALFVETKNPQNVLAAILITDCLGRGSFDFDSSYRIQEAYGLAGKKMASFIINYL